MIMEKAQGYSLWLMPSDDVYDQLHSTIRELGRAYETPVFEPHVTLVGGVQEEKNEIISKTEQLSHQLEPYTVSLLDIEYLPEYFRCLYYKVDETKGVLDAHVTACRVFDLPDNNDTYMPHLSLVYGTLQQQTKEKITASLHQDAKISFLVRYIDIFSTHGQVDKWYNVKRVAL